MPPAQQTRAQSATKSIATGLLPATLGAIAFSGKTIIVKLAYRYGVDAVTRIMYRMLFALLRPLCTAVPVMMAIGRIGASMAAQTGMVGPMSTILMGVLILGKPFTAWAAAGTVLVIAGIFVFTRSAPSP
ncbi:MAG: EamA family transporter [Polaromonas sp.]